MYIVSVTPVLADFSNFKGMLGLCIRREETTNVISVTPNLPDVPHFRIMLGLKEKITQVLRV